MSGVAPPHAGRFLVGSAVMVVGVVLPLVYMMLRWRKPSTTLPKAT